jgi:hypothetical protein
MAQFLTSFALTDFAQTRWMDSVSVVAPLLVGLEDGRQRGKHSVLADAAQGVDGVMSASTMTSVLRRNHLTGTAEALTATRVRKSSALAKKGGES